MMISENVRMGLHSVRKSRFRSMFTMLGVIIGVVSVITIVSLGEGVKRQVATQVNELGTNLLTIRPGKLVNRDVNGSITSVNLFGASGAGNLTSQDLASIRKQEGVIASASLSVVSGVPMNGSKSYESGTVIATQPDLVKVIDHPVEFGSFFKSDEEGKKVAVIGADVALKLYGEAVPIGKTITIRDQPFIIQGIFEPFRNGPISAELDYNNTIFIPSNYAKSLSADNLTTYEIIAKFSSESAEASTAKAITEALKKNHAGKEDFTVLKESEASLATASVLELLTKMIAGMAGITLLVGGIGIMNVMLVSVSERTREIGIRKAIGATNRQIRQQFIVEATVLSVWGVILGIIASVLLNFVLRIVTDLEPVLTWQPIIVASLLSLAVGILAGVIPAIKASYKDPIDALRPN